MRAAAFTLLILLLLAVVGGVWLLSEGVSLEFWRGRLESRLSVALDADARIHGALHIDLFPPGFEFERVSIAPSRRHRLPGLAEIDHVVVELDLWQLLNGVLQIDELHFSGVDLLLEIDAEGRRNWAAIGGSGSAPRDQSSFEVRLAEVDLEEVRVVYRDVPGQREWKAEVERFGLSGIGEAALEMETRGRVEDVSFDFSAQLASLASGDAVSGPYDVTLQGKILDGRIEAGGRIQEPFSMRALDLQLQLAFRNLSEFSEIAGFSLPKLGPIRARGRLSDSSGKLALSDLSIEVGDQQTAWLDLEGSVADLSDLSTVAVAARFGTPDVGALRSMLGFDAPPLGRVEGSAQVQGEPGDIDVEAIDVAVGSPEHVQLQLRGVLDNVLQDAELDVTWRLAAVDLEQFGLLRGWKLPPIGPLLATGHVVHRDGALGIEDVDLRLGDGEKLLVEIRGGVADLRAMRGVRLEAEVFAADPHSIGDRLAGLPFDLGTVRGKMRFSDADGALGIEEFQVRAGHEALSLVISGGIDDVREIDEIDVRAELKARDLAVLGDAFDATLPPIGPVEFSGRVIGSDERLTAEKMKVRLDETRFEGNLRASFAPGTRPSLEAWIEAPLVRLRDIGIEPRPEDAPPLKRSRDAEPPSWEILRVGDAEVTLRADRVTGYSGFELDEFAASLHLRDGVLELRAMEVLTQGGSTSGEAKIDARRDPPRAELQFKVRGADLARFLAQFTQEKLAAGIVHGDLELGTELGSGRVLRSLAGRIRFIVEGGWGDSRFARSFARDMTRAVFSREWRGDTQPINCVIADFEIDGGVATARRLLLDTENITVLGEGKIDLGRGHYELLLNPRLKDPGVLSTVARVRVTGPLDDPNYEPVVRSLATSAVRNFFSSLGTKVSRPFTAAWRRGVPPQGPCAKILELVEAAR